MCSKLSNNLTSVEVPLLQKVVIMNNREEYVINKRQLTNASPSQPALKYPFSSCSIERAETGPRWPFITWHRRPVSWRTVKRLICPVYKIDMTLIFEIIRWPDPHYFPPMPIVRLSASVNYTRGTLQALLRPVNLHRILKDRDSPTSIGFGQLSLYLQQRRSDVFAER